jgi:zinc transporter, ZIP family
VDERFRGLVTVGTEGARSARLPEWGTALGPLILIALLIAGFIAFDPIKGLRPAPPLEALAVERTTFAEGSIELEVRNDGPDSVTIAQVLVNDAYRDFHISNALLDRLETSVVEVDYPWEEGLPVSIGFVTSSGLVITHDIEAAALTPHADSSTLWIYALLGLFIGVVPVAVGLLWFPALRRAGPKWVAFFLAFTIGLLLFLLLDTVAEGLELAGETAQVLNGLGLLGLGAVAALAGLVALESWLEARRKGAGRDEAVPGLALAYLVATGIGLHNLGEGLAVGAALAAGEVALGTFLVIGFAVHNTTEGLAIVAPLSSARRSRDEGARPSLWHFAALGAVAGAPTILGTWTGGFAFLPAAAALAFGLAAGAIAQVVYQIGKSMKGERRLGSALGMFGLLTGFAVMYLTGLLAA